MYLYKKDAHILGCVPWSLYSYTLRTQTGIDREPSQVGVTVPYDLCWNSRLGSSCPSTIVSASLQQTADAAVLCVLLFICPSVLSYGNKLKSDQLEEMGSCFVGAPSAPQGPPKQVEGEETRKIEGDKVLKGCWIEKANKRGSCF